MGSGFKQSGAALCQGGDAGPRQPAESRSRADRGGVEGPQGARRNGAGAGPGEGPLFADRDEWRRLSTDQCRRHLVAALWRLQGQDGAADRAAARAGGGSAAGAGQHDDGRFGCGDAAIDGRVRPCHRRGEHRRQKLLARRDAAWRPQPGAGQGAQFQLWPADHRGGRAAGGAGPRPAQGADRDGRAGDRRQRRARHPGPGDRRISLSRRRGDHQAAGIFDAVGARPGRGLTQIVAQILRLHHPRQCDREGRSGDRRLSAGDDRQGQDGLDRRGGDTVVRGRRGAGRVAVRHRPRQPAQPRRAVRDRLSRLLGQARDDQAALWGQGFPPPGGQCRRAGRRNLRLSPVGQDRRRGDDDGGQHPRAGQ